MVVYTVDFVTDAVLIQDYYTEIVRYETLACMSPTNSQSFFIQSYSSTRVFQLYRHIDGALDDSKFTVREIRNPH